MAHGLGDVSIVLSTSWLAQCGGDFGAPSSPPPGLAAWGGGYAAASS